MSFSSGKYLWFGMNAVAMFFLKSHLKTGITMLSIYGKKLRPQHEMEKIISATSCVEERTLKKWQKISTADSGLIHIIVRDRKSVV